MAKKNEDLNRLLVADRYFNKTHLLHILLHDFIIHFNFVDFLDALFTWKFITQVSSDRMRVTTDKEQQESQNDAILLRKVHHFGDRQTNMIPNEQKERNI